ncbi:MAG: hypothetical protein LiPW15_743 [Parcubacteria group bacterium LiPW_15]|nr:MAG: hypothetical protein LiPW15_743 [Parcubacteria group bacterium LiPW_15]
MKKDDKDKKGEEKKEAKKTGGWIGKIIRSLILFLICTLPLLGAIAWWAGIAAAVDAAVIILDLFILFLIGRFAYRATKETFFGVPPNQAAIIARQWFSDATPVRTGRVVTQRDFLPVIKMAAKIPWADQAQFVELKEKTLDFTAKVIAMDGMSINISGTLAYVPDFCILDAGGVPVFGTTTEADIVTKARAIAKNKIGAVGNVTDSDTILQSLPTIDQMLKGVMQTSQLPHLHIPGGDTVPAKDLVSFYAANWKAIDEQIKLHNAAAAEHSDLELTNGIDIRWVKTESPALSAESQKAKDEKARVAAIQKGHANATAMVKQFMTDVPKASSAAAINFVAQELYRDNTTRVINSVETSEGAGAEGLLALAAANLGKAAGKGK